MDSKKNKNPIKSFYIPLIGVLIVLAALVAVSTSVADVKETAGTGNEKISVEPNIQTVVTPSDKGKSGDSDGGNKDKGKDRGLEVTLPAETEKAPQTEPETEETEEAAAPEVPPTFVTPVSGVLIKGFSDTVPVFSETMNDYRVHAGVDVSAGEGEAVRAVADGKITAVWDDPMMGKCVSVEHSAGFVSTYKGLHEIIPDYIAEGAEVKAGQPVGAIGESALIEIAEVPHVHFELTKDGVSVDPASYITFATEESYDE